MKRISILKDAKLSGAVTNAKAALGEKGDSERGSVLVFAAVLLFVLIAVGALAVDISALESRAQTLQNAADAAALGGATTLSETGSTGQADLMVRSLLRHNNVDLNEDGVSYTVSYQAGNKVRVTVTDSKPDVFLAFLPGLELDGVTRSAVASRPTANLPNLPPDIPISPPFATQYTEDAEDVLYPVPFGSQLYFPVLASNSIGCTDRSLNWGGGQNCTWSHQDQFPSYGPSSLQIAHAAVASNKIWYVGHDDGTDLMVFCFEPLADRPCNSHLTLAEFETPEHPVGGGIVEYRHKVWVIDANLKTYCIDPDTGSLCSSAPNGFSTSMRHHMLEGVSPPWRESRSDLSTSDNQGHVVGDGIDRILDESTGRLYHTQQVFTDPDDTDGGTELWLDCVDLDYMGPCSSFTPSQIEANTNNFRGRLHFTRTTEGTIDGLCARLNTSWRCFSTNGAVNGNGTNMSAAESIFAANFTGSWSSDFFGTSTYHQGSNRLFIPLKESRSAVMCWDFTEQAECGVRNIRQKSGLGWQKVPITGLITEGNCLIGHGDYKVVRFSIYFEDNTTCNGTIEPGRGATQDIWAISMSSSNGYWPLARVGVGSRFAGENPIPTNYFSTNFSKFEVTVYAGDNMGTEVLSTVDLVLNPARTSINLDGVDPALGRVTIAVKAKPRGSAHPWNNESTTPYIYFDSPIADPQLDG